MKTLEIATRARAIYKDWRKSIRTRPLDGNDAAVHRVAPVKDPTGSYGTNPAVRRTLFKSEIRAVLMMAMNMLPSRPDPPSEYPEKLIEEAEARARMWTLSATTVDAKRDSREGDFATHERGEPAFRSRGLQNETW